MWQREVSAARSGTALVPRPRATWIVTFSLTACSQRGRMLPTLSCAAATPRLRTLCALGHPAATAERDLPEVRD